MKRFGLLLLVSGSLFAQTLANEVVYWYTLDESYNLTLWVAGAGIVVRGPTIYVTFEAKSRYTNDAISSRLVTVKQTSPVVINSATFPYSPVYPVVAPFYN